ncbi:hypothetical protein EPI10_007497 [Gossypium australe]|uniref:Uncharacterized protein n=1 Tax=Gossypium australe TaxID=47621 RepID=A0A5B6WUD4_9ROSI|nr:hypothetical protein EPI10_007497 [Gossypium australe]
MDHLNVGKKIRNPDEASLSFNLSSFDISPAIYRTPPFQSILESGAPLVCRIDSWVRIRAFVSQLDSLFLLSSDRRRGKRRYNPPESFEYMKKLIKHESMSNIDLPIG